MNEKELKKQQQQQEILQKFKDFVFYEQL